MSLHLRKSRVLEKMRNGQVATCVKINLSDPRGIEIASMSDFDCLWVDYEHIPNNNESIENAVRVTKIYDKDILTRVSKGSYSDLIHPLEADSTAIMVPHLMSLEEAKKIVYFTKFYPIGKRPFDSGNADGSFGLVSGADYIKEANEERFVVVQIEDPEPMEELEQICALDGIDMLFFGPADYSQAIGKPLQFGCEEVMEAKRKVAECARRHGKWVGTIGEIDTFDQLVEMGYTFISVGTDSRALNEYYGKVCSAINGRKIK